MTSSVLLFNIGDSRIRQRLERIPGTEFFPLLFSVTHARSTHNNDVARPCHQQTHWSLSFVIGRIVSGPRIEDPRFLLLHSSTLRKEKKKASPRLTTLAPRHYILWREEKEAKEESNAALTLTSQACATQKHTHKQLKASGEKQGGDFW